LGIVTQKKRKVKNYLFRTHLVLNVIANFIRFESFLIEPYMPSTSAKINFLLGLEDRTQHDAVLGKVLNEGVGEGEFKKVFLGLTSKSKGIRQPVPLFNTFTEEQAAVWRDKFRGKQIT
jgi:methionyl-tRNA synthetase